MSMSPTSTGTEANFEDYKLWYVNASDIPAVWPQVVDLIAKTDDPETHHSDIYQELAQGNWVLWIATDSDGVIKVACTVHIVFYPKTKVCRVETIGGDGMEHWLKFLHPIEEWAKLNECTAMDVWGRRGWERALKTHGYSFEATLLRKRFDDKQGDE